tara:strand:- start:1354 stop:1749 length:396 start_codon:yes stop_codon:yes gene_type:complete
MDSLKISKKDTTPELSFDIDEMVFSMEGECRPENVLTYFEPIMRWLDQFIDEVKSNSTSKKLDFHFKLEYYNSSSAKFIFQMFKRFKKIEASNIEVTMYWFYDILDEDLLECGEEYEKFLDLNFKYIALQD